MEKKNKVLGDEYLQFACNTECFNKKLTSQIHQYKDIYELYSVRLLCLKHLIYRKQN